MGAGLERLVQERRSRLAAEQQRNRAEAQLALLKAELAQIRAPALRARLGDLRAPGFAAPRPDVPPPEDLGELIRTGLELVSDGFALYGSGARLLYANRTYLAALPEIGGGAIGAEYRQICGQLIASGRILPDDPGESPAEWLERLLARWESDPIPDYVMRFRSGAVSRVMEFHAGDLVVSLVRDITASLRRQAQLDEAARRAEAASRAKSAFLANMSHEIRTPMNGIVGMAQVLAETPLSPEQQHYLATLRASGEALLGVIGDVLDYSRLEAEALSLEPVPFDLERGILELLILQEAEAARRHIGLSLAFDPASPTRYRADPARMRQLLGNLIGNAVKFTEAGEVAVTVRAGEGGVEITVRDTGIGISPEDQARIFQGFEQVEEEASRRFDGVGLGLAISHRLVSLMGGQIRVESALGEGAVFGLRLPLEPLEPCAEEVPQLPSGAPVLVILSDVMARRLLQRQLEALGARVVALADPRGAAELPACALIFLEAGEALPELARFGAPLVRLGPGHEEAPAAIRLPLAPARAELRAALAARKPESGGAAGALPMARAAGGGQRLRVLVAEDNRTNRLVFARMADDLEIELVFAEDGEAAVASFAELGPDLVFMDISMPRMDGRDATRRIRALPGGSSVPILALTAHAHGTTLEDLGAGGMDGLLAKPLRKSELVEAISRFRPKPQPQPQSGAG